MEIKYRILKAIDVAGLQILDPVVRLCYREQPREQLRKIGLFIVIPVLTFAGFMIAWDYLGPRHTTKAGEVPTPAVVLDAGSGIMTFHEREGIKSDDFLLDGERRTAELAAVEARIEELAPLAAEATERVAQAEDSARERLIAAVEPANDDYKAKRRQFKTASKEREAALLETAATITPGDETSAAALLKAVSDHLAQTEAETETIKEVREARKAIEDTRDSEVAAARLASNAIEEEMQFLRKRRDLLSTENRALQAARIEAELAATKKALIAATTAEERVKHAKKIIALQGRLEQVNEANYSKAWTLPGQITRSLWCVFAGFVLASVIAIPIGVLCGMSKVIMSALTPLISLFKPVSPIVWLPIVFIIVGGFIPDPSNSTFLSFLNSIPGLKGLDVNPAFLASAITVALCSLWPTLVNTALGVAAVDKDHMNVARVLRLGFFSRLFRIIVPSALPLIFAGLRISLGVGWMVLIAAELLSSSEGIGKFVWDMFNNGSSQTFAQMFVVVFVVGIIGLILDRIMIVFQRLVSFDGAPTAL